MWHLLSTAAAKTSRIVQEYATPAIGWYWRGIGGLLMVMVVGLICWAFAYWLSNEFKGRY